MSNHEASKGRQGHQGRDRRGKGGGGNKPFVKRNIPLIFNDTLVQFGHNQEMLYLAEFPEGIPGCEDLAGKYVKVGGRRFYRDPGHTIVCNVSFYRKADGNLTMFGFALPSAPSSLPPDVWAPDKDLYRVYVRELYFRKENDERHGEQWVANDDDFYGQRVILDRKDARRMRQPGIYRVLIARERDFVSFATLVPEMPNIQEITDAISTATGLAVDQGAEIPKEFYLKTRRPRVKRKEDHFGPVTSVDHIHVGYEEIDTDTMLGLPQAAWTVATINAAHRAKMVALSPDRIEKFRTSNIQLYVTFDETAKAMNTAKEYALRYLAAVEAEQAAESGDDAADTEAAPSTDVADTESAVATEPVATEVAAQEPTAEAATVAPEPEPAVDVVAGPAGTPTAIGTPEGTKRVAKFQEKYRKGGGKKEGGRSRGRKTSESETASGATMEDKLKAAGLIPTPAAGDSNGNAS